MSYRVEEVRLGRDKVQRRGVVYRFDVAKSSSNGKVVYLTKINPEGKLNNT